MTDLFFRLFPWPQGPIFAAMLGLQCLGMALEAVASGLRGRQRHGARDTAANLAMYAGHAAINALWIPVVFQIYTWCRRHALVEWGAGGFHLGQHGWWKEWLALFVLEDLCFYVFHRTSHAWGFFWASHISHHSSQRYNLSTAFRQTWTPFVALPFWLPLPFLGFDPLMILSVQAMSLFYQSWLHTELSPPLRVWGWIFNTPEHHQVHHAENAKYFGKNMGGVLILWDRLFGSFARAEEPLRYGIGQKVSDNPLRIAFDEWWAWLGKNLRRGP